MLLGRDVIYGLGPTVKILSESVLRISRFLKHFTISPPRAVELAPRLASVWASLSVALKTS